MIDFTYGTNIIDKACNHLCKIEKYQSKMVKFLQVFIRYIRRKYLNKNKLWLIEFRTEQVKILNEYRSFYSKRGEEKKIQIFSVLSLSAHKIDEIYHFSKMRIHANFHFVNGLLQNYCQLTESIRRQESRK